MADYQFENWRQDDPRWGGDPYAGQSIAEAGCALGASGDISCEKPPAVGSYMTAHGYASNGSGTYWSGIPAYLKSKGYAAVQLNANSLLGVTVCAAFDAWRKAIHSGICGALCMGGPSRWTGGGHYICITGGRFRDGVEEFRVHDPAHRNNGWQPWTAFIGWIKVLYIGGKRWKPEEAPEEFNRIDSGECTENGVILRLSPSGYGIQVGTVDKGNRFDVDGKREAGFVHIKIATAGICWIPEQYVLLDSDKKPQPKEYEFTWPAVGPESSGRHVFVWQKVLASMHLYNGAINGRSNSELTAGTRRFQAMRNLEEDGWAGRLTFTAASNLIYLEKEKKFILKRVKFNSEGDSVLFLQRLLSADHYYNGTLDAHCGLGTDAGIRGAQKDLGIKADGDAWTEFYSSYIGL